MENVQLDNITAEVKTDAVAEAKEPEVKEPKKPTKKKRKHRELKSFLIHVLVIGTLIAIAFVFFFNIQIYNAQNMYPTIRDGEFVLISKVSPVLNETVVLYKTEDGGKRLGRVLAFGGNEVSVSEDGGVTVDGNIIYQTIPYKTPLGNLEYPYTVPEDSYFIINDYREDTMDSRELGGIPKSQIIGVVIFAMQYRGF